ncbi:hypothetical protein [Chelatococcus asaccharovorans]|uniref:hypothetical protein n=1 Tax=Chelatococcus asaccharovorans TaxID=28210 RepID=UPI0011B5B3E6|nr:hypothetical protein [Chelatococcus asaccharovorans]MBS7702784.1 hypothetical protein [Chelatococcus asaccharovorans]
MVDALTSHPAQILLPPSLCQLVPQLLERVAAGVPTTGIKSRLAMALSEFLRITADEIPEPIAIPALQVAAILLEDKRSSSIGEFGEAARYVLSAI